MLFGARPHASAAPSGRPRGRASVPVRGRARHPQLRRVRRHRRAGLRHRQRPSLCPTHPHDERPGGGEAGEREGHLRQRCDRPALCDHPKRVLCLRSPTEQLLWNRTYEGGCDRMAISPDGKTIYVPSFERARTGTCSTPPRANEIARIEPNSGAHNTVYGAGRQARLPGRPEVATAAGRRYAHAHGHADGRAVSATSSARSRSTAGRPSAS